MTEQSWGEKPVATNIVDVWEIVGRYPCPDAGYWHDPHYRRIVEGDALGGWPCDGFGRPVRPDVRPYGLLDEPRSEGRETLWVMLAMLAALVVGILVAVLLALGQEAPVSAPACDVVYSTAAFGG